MGLTHKGTQPIETERLLLRRFEATDAEDMFRGWASDKNVTRYFSFAPHKTPGETKTIIAQWLAGYEELNNYQYAIEIKSTKELIGSITARVKDKSETAEMGYCIGAKYWNKGYATEALRALIHYMFYDIGINRIEAYHSVNNPASGKVMGKAGMYREGICRQKYMSNQGWQDCDIYGLVREDFDKIYMPELKKFLDLSKSAALVRHNVKLECIEYFGGDKIRNRFPAYNFNIKEINSDVILGEISLRLGFNGNIYYGGHIGYSVRLEFRNMGIATIAVGILLQTARKHGFGKLIITNEYMNKASRRVCEKSGAKLVRIAELPEWHDLYVEGQRFVSIYEIDLPSY